MLSPGSTVASPLLPSWLNRSPSTETTCQRRLASTSVEWSEQPDPSKAQNHQPTRSRLSRVRRGRLTPRAAIRLLSPARGIARPYLLGLTYARPSDPSEMTIEWTSNSTPASFNPRRLYRYPDVQIPHHIFAHHRSAFSAQQLNPPLLSPLRPLLAGPGTVEDRTVGAALGAVEAEVFGRAGGVCREAAEGLRATVEAPCGSGILQGGGAVAADGEG